MKARVLMVAGLICVVAAACSPPAQDGADGGAPSGAPVTDMTSMQPGQYRTTVTVLEMNMPGVPASAMQNMNMQPISTEECVTSTDIADFASNDMQVEEGVTCTQNSMNTAGGRIEGSSTCQGPTGARTMQMSGSYTSTHVEMDISSTAQMPNGAGEMTQRMRIVTDRIGDCPAGATSAAP
jgi:hypothetical protein